MCEVAGFPLVPLPGGNVFFSNEDATTPPDSHGNQLITCHQVTALEALRDIWKALRLIDLLFP